MNPSMTFEEQTEQIVEALFSTLCLKKQESPVSERCLKLHSAIEPHFQGTRVSFKTKLWWGVGGWLCISQILKSGPAAGSSCLE